jgi:NTE family protein
MNCIVYRKQRALVLGAGGALGAYEIGVLKTLCQKLKEQDKENGDENRLLFDIVIGTSIGAIIGAILVGLFLKTKSWEYAIEQLEEFFKDSKKGLASDISQKDFSNLPCWNRWLDALKNNVKGIAQEEAIRRKASALVGSENVYFCSNVIEDNKFYDNEHNSWHVYDYLPLKDKILNLVDFPIATDIKKNEPRLLVCAVDASEGEIVVFDSYTKEDGTRKSEFGKYAKDKGYEYTIRYPGITLEHILGSASVPEYFGYTSVPVNQTDILSSSSNNDINNKNEIRYLMDGYLLSSVPFRELLSIYQSYWMTVPITATTIDDNDVNANSNIPDLEAYIISLYPSKSINNIQPDDHDGMICRQNDILFSDRNSVYEEKMLNQKMVLVKGNLELIDLVKESVDKICNEKDKKKISEKLHAILKKNTIIKDKRGNSIKYKDLLRIFKLNVFRYERENDRDCVSQSVADFSCQSINALISQGEKDTSDCFS